MSVLFLFMTMLSRRFGLSAVQQSRMERFVRRLVDFREVVLRITPRLTREMPVLDRFSPECDVGFYFALVQTGVEMVVPIAIGAFLDNLYGWSPWATAVGAVLGMAGELWHMLLLIKRNEERH